DYYCAIGLSSGYIF
nr:immunoglobulin light chain junction region [Macaca mulatta]MOV67817.1 immunoglobulin light chain junction region [Macaca mulatta]MOV67994.1 immunoglobulin light chain junction region [Macaca mulatta]MOV68317.1 immunoglobulin light chain junction region [Macaca mulatta]MOV69257.1 immunoglobulin light chain junction region [Macaca mulatta]